MGSIPTYQKYVVLHSETQQDFLAPVPEPESYAMMLAGLGVIGFVWRRRINSAV